MSTDAPEYEPIPPEFEMGLKGLSPAVKNLIVMLHKVGQDHVVRDFNCGTGPTIRRELAKQLEDLDAAYSDGGLIGYIQNARRLLDDSSKGVNPLEGWIPSVPDGESFELGTPEYDETEAIGLNELGSVGFVLVAGGLGERLGYNGIKVGLPTDLATETCYLNYYIDYILAVEKKYANGRQLPLCIMTSGDTNDRTVRLLSKNNYFGMKKDQITIVQQGQGVPALTDNKATIALHPKYAHKILTKPHGHGDIHELLYQHGVADKWLKQGMKWLILFQDTNGLAFHTLPLMLGVSTKLDLIMNSLAIPRKAKQAIGAITKLENQETGEVRTINVEYNQLDPLLRATSYPDGDVNDKETGFSPFPGNINQLLFRLEPYARTLERTKGRLQEFVNPKYKDESRTEFKKPTRLECMMQDFPTALKGDDTKRVGFTSVTADLCFSPVKNATEDGVKLQEQGLQPGTAASGEADQYGAFRKILRSIGCEVEPGLIEDHLGIKVDLMPAIILKPDFALCPAEVKAKFPNPEKVRISGRSSLVIRGEGVIIDSLELDGALIVDCKPGRYMTIKDMVVKNEGWVWKKLENSSDAHLQMRGYQLIRKQTESILLDRDDDMCAIL